MTNVEMQESFMKIREELTLLQDAFYDLIDKHSQLNESIELLLKDNDTAYENGKRDGKNEIIRKLDEYVKSILTSMQDMRDLKI